MGIVRHDVEGCTSRAPKGPLGIYAKSSSPSDPQKCEKYLKYQALRDAKYTLQNYIRAIILRDEGYGSTEVIDLDEYNQLHRVVKCVRGKVKPAIEIRQETESSKAFYKGLFTCGSVWACPICSAKIQQQRREEVAKALVWADESGLQAIMVTLTFPHYEFDQVETLLKKQAEALKYFRSGKSFQAFKASVGLEGFIRSLEVTYGGNGWHPHTHELWFVAASAFSQPAVGSLGESPADYIRSRWEKACSKAGLIPRGKLKAFRQHAVDIKADADCSDYLVKQDDENNFWGLDSEMTLSVLKRGKGTIHPFELVQLAKNGDPKAAKRFVEYVYAMKGKAQLFWSKGLKKRALVEEVTDDEIAASTADESISIADLETFAWQAVLDRRARSHLLRLAENGGHAAVDSWLRQYGVNAVTKLWQMK